MLQTILPNCKLLECTEGQGSRERVREYPLFDRILAGVNKKDRKKDHNLNAF